VRNIYVGDHCDNIEVGEKIRLSMDVINMRLPLPP